MTDSYFLKVIYAQIALILEHEGLALGEPASDGTIQANFPLVGVRILEPGGSVQNHPQESWTNEATTNSTIFLASL